MTTVVAQNLPPASLLARYLEQGVYTDCFVTTIPIRVGQARYVEAFYSSPLFKLERLFLALVVARPSTDGEARDLAAGDLSKFAAWTVEARSADQILLCDFKNLTRSWLMSVRGAETTTLYFGTAVAPRKGDRVGGSIFRALAGLHQLYARALLRSAVSRLGSLAQPGE